MNIQDLMEDKPYQVPHQGRIGNVGVLVIPTNPNCLEFAARKIIAEGYASRDKHGWGFGKDGEQPELIALLWGVDGVESILLRDRYTMMVSKAVSFTWDEMLPTICGIIEQWQGGAA